MIGEQVSAVRRTLLRELRDGDVLGDHTFTHPDLLAAATCAASYSETIDVIRSLTGYTPCVFRPPYGDYDQSIIDSALAWASHDPLERRPQRLHPARQQRDRAART